MNNQFLILVDTLFGVILIPLGICLHFSLKFIKKFIRTNPKRFLVIKLLGAGNFLPIKNTLARKDIDIVTVKSNFLTLKHFHIGSQIYVIDDTNILTLAITSLLVFIQLLFRDYVQVINLELESKFAKFLSLITPASILSGISSQNKSFLDSLIYDTYLVTPLMLSKAEIVSQLLSFKKKKNVLVDSLVNNHKRIFLERFFPLKNINKVSIFPSCSSTDALRRLSILDWEFILIKLSNNNKVKVINIIFANSEDCQYREFSDLLVKLNLEKIQLILTDFPNFVAIIEGSNLVVSVDSQALHISQFLHKRAIAIYGPTSPFGINLENTTYPITNSLQCSPCTHKYIKLPCNNTAPCMKFKSEYFNIFD